MTEDHSRGILKNSSSAGCSHCRGSSAVNQLSLQFGCCSAQPKAELTWGFHLQPNHPLHLPRCVSKVNPVPGSSPITFCSHEPSVEAVSGACPSCKGERFHLALRGSGDSRDGAAPAAVPGWQGSPGAVAVDVALQHLRSSPGLCYRGWSWCLPIGITRNVYCGRDCKDPESGLG